MGDYGGDYWERVREEVRGINRMDESWMVAQVHVVVRNRSVRKIGVSAFSGYSNLVKVAVPFVEEVGEYAFARTFNLRYLGFNHDVVVKPRAFIYYLSLEVLRASVGFELNTGDKVCVTGFDRNDPTVGITRFAK